MTDLEIIDMDTYYRAEHFRHFMAHKCSISITSDIDVSKLVCFTKANNLKIYPVLLWVVSKAVNAIPDFKLTINEQGHLARYGRIDPSYIAFNKEKKNIYCLTTKYEPDLIEFYKNCVDDIESNNNKTMFPQGFPSPKNTFSVSSSSELSFSSITIGIDVQRMPLSPIIAMGRICEKQGVQMLPCAVQVNHAVSDGYHIALFVKEMQNVISSIGEIEIYS